MDQTADGDLGFLAAGLGDDQWRFAIPTELGLQFLVFLLQGDDGFFKCFEALIQIRGSRTHRDGAGKAAEKDETGEGWDFYGLLVV